MYLPACAHLSLARALTLVVPLSDLSPLPRSLARSLTLALWIPASRSSGEVTPP